MGARIAIGTTGGLEAAPRVFAPAAAGPWLFGRATDLWVFGGSAALSLGLLALAWSQGVAEAELPPWAWIACVLAIDVAHVWSTAFRVYLDGDELRRRPLLYLGIPIGGLAFGMTLYAFGPMVFWRTLAYLAVFHFIRQQYGWLVLYRRRAGEKDPLDRWLDTAAIYAATVYPLIHWHASLPRRFVWFMQGDFVAGLASPVADALLPAYVGIGVAFVGRQLWLLARGRPVNAGKVLLVATTWACWWAGIIAFDGDLAFTITNVLIHGVPYLALTYRWGRARAAVRPKALIGRMLRHGLVLFLGFILVAAFVEEALWDRYVWRERGWLFGEGGELDPGVLVFLVPLLALPQLVHYVLDGFIWRTRGADNPGLNRALEG